MKICEYGDPAAQAVLIQPVDEQDLSVIENEVNVIKQLSDRDFRLITFKVENWNRDLSPWKAPAVFGKRDFGDGAEDTLSEILKVCSDRDREYIIGGYSLAALFALWASYQTDVFAAAAAASPSMWFPGFIEYMSENVIRCKAVYLSLGDKEERTKNRVMATVGDRIREAYDILQKAGIESILEWNAGNHFNESDVRTAKAFARVLNGIG